jgi:integrase
MAADNLTDERIRRLKPGPNGAFLWDAKLSGFGVRVTPSGTKSFVVGFRTGRRWRLKAIGRVGEMALSVARDHAREMLVAVRKGVDPVAESEARRNALTVRTMLDRWMKEHSERENRPATIAKNRALIRRNLQGAISRIPAAVVKRADVDNLKSQLRAKPVEFNRTLALLRAAFNWAIRNEVAGVDTNPAASVRPYAEQPRDRVLSPDELRRIAAALSELEAQGANKYAVLAVRLLAMTGWRISEVLGLRWQDLRPDRGEALLIDTKTGTRWASISTEALAILDGIQRVGEHVFPGRSRAGGLGYGAVADTLKRACKRAGVADVSPHVFRASAATAMAEAGASVFALRDAFGWKGLAMPQRYVKRAAQSAREAVAQYGARTAAILGGSAEGEIVDIGPKQGGNKWRMKPAR